MPSGLLSEIGRIDLEKWNVELGNCGRNTHIQKVHPHHGPLLVHSPSLISWQLSGILTDMNKSGATKQTDHSQVS
jgi:hypothetical protein